MGKLTILCVDDEHNVLLSLRTQLMRFFPDCMIEIAESASEALELVENLISDGQDLALVIADQIMPNMRGDQFLIELHSRYPEILKVMLTGQANVENITNVVNRGNLYRFVSKPWNETDLKLTVGAALRRYEQEKQLAEQKLALEQTNLELIELNANLKYANAEVEKVSKLKDEFLSIMSNELVTPFISILGMSECLLDEVYGAVNTRQKDAIATIKNSSNHLLKLINDIVYFSKLTTDLVELDIKSVLISDLCDSSLDFVKQNAHEKQIQIITNIDPEVNFFEADPNRMRQVLINLLDNAIKYTPIGGKVYLEVKIEYQPPSNQFVSSNVTKTSVLLNQIAENSELLKINYWVSFAITDTGIGISPSDYERLFQPFIKIDSGLNRDYEGLGIGLSTVKQIVELHHGYLDLSSQLDKGSCFVVGIPIKDRIIIK